MFTPKFQNFVDAIRNEEVDRTPLYEHKISPLIMESITGKKFAHLKDGDFNDKVEFFKHYCNFYLDHGYDTVSYEGCLTAIMPFGGALAHPKPGYIDCIEKFESYPFDDVLDLYIKKFDEDFKALKEVMPEGMKAVGGVGNGVFELAEDICGYENLCLLSVDDEDLYCALFKKIGDVMLSVWKWLLENHGDVFCVCRFGDDLGYKSNTLISHSDIKEHIVPQYKRIVDLVHSHNKPFLLHSCGKIFDVMDEIISVANIDAKHSNEDQIADFEVWVDKYGEKIANVGGIDTDHLVRMDKDKLEILIKRIFEYCHKGHGGFAMGSGNSIPEYVDEDRYLFAIETIRKLRGEILDCK